MISIWNNKGGVGKSSLAYSLCLDLDTYYMTNDTYNSLISQNYPKTIKEIPNEEFFKNERIIFDGGGFIDKDLSKFLKASSLVIVPLEVDLNSLTSLSNFYFDLIKLNKNVIFVLNKVENTKSGLKDKQEVLEYLNKEYGIDEANLYVMPFSKIFKKIFDLDLGVNQILSSSKINTYRYRNIKKDYNDLLNRVLITI